MLISDMFKLSLFLFKDVPDVSLVQNYVESSRLSDLAFFVPQFSQQRYNISVSTQHARMGAK